MNGQASDLCLAMLLLLPTSYSSNMRFAKSLCRFDKVVYTKPSSSYCILPELGDVSGHDLLRRRYQLLAILSHSPRQKPCAMEEKSWKAR